MDVYWTYLGLFFLGTFIFSFSTLTGGGGGLLLVPICNSLLGTNAAAPTINAGNAVARPFRMLLFWKHISWSVTFYYILPAIVSSWLGAWLFSEIKLHFLKIFVGLFLISTLFQFKFGKSKLAFKTQPWHFFILGLFVPLLGTLIGGMGPILNPFFLNLGLSKEALTGTKTANSFFVGLAQISGYWYFGSLELNILKYALALGLGIMLGSFIGKKLLGKISNQQFKQLVVYMLAISGFVMVIKVLLTF